MNIIPKNIYSKDSTNNFIWLFSQIPKAFKFYMVGCEYDFHVVDENVCIDIDNLVKIIDELLKKVLLELKIAFVDGYINLCPTLLPIYDLNNNKVKDILFKIKDEINENNNYLEMSKITLVLIEKVEQYIHYQKEFEKYIRRLESENIQIVELKKTGDINLSKFISEF